MTHTCHIVFHTHWDREWYFPYEVFRHRLIQVMKRIVDGLEAGEMKQFVLDGQAAALDDILEVCEPDLEERLRMLIRQEKIIIGPWYVLADEFLVGGEALIRNLELGLTLSRTFGRPQNIGYLPDTFGHISQMPQILQGFGIDNAILWRGLDSKQSELHWKAPDGSRVFTVFLPEGYYQPLLDGEDPQAGVAAYVEKVKPYATTSQLLLTNGGDHLMPGFGNPTEKIRSLNVENVEFVESHYEHYISTLKKEVLQDLPVHTGEMRSNDHIYLLPDVLSARTYLKKQNQTIEDELTGYVEPLLALCTKDPRQLPARYLDDTWKLLMQNHPHDSICGCSVDEVHREMETRSMKLSQRVRLLQEEALCSASALDLSISGSGRRKPWADDSRFLVFNPHPVRYTGWVKGRIWRERGESVKFHIVDPSGAKIEPVLSNISEDRYFASPYDAFPEFRDAVFLEIAFLVANLPACSLTSFELVDDDGSGTGPTSIEPAEAEASEAWTIENEWLHIKLKSDGTLVMMDQVTKVEYDGLLQFYSSLDAGDAYNYSPPLQDQPSFARLAGVPSAFKSEDVQTLCYQLTLPLPSGLNADRTGPAAAWTKITVSVRMTLYAADRAVNVSIRAVNQARDQRLRMKFPLGVSVDETYADSAFDIVRRVAKKESVQDVAKQKETPVVTEPSHSFTRAGKNGRGLTFFHRGLQEYQITSDGEQDVLEVTVLRSVGWLSRDDLRTRGGGAGPGLATPEGQCLGTHEFEFAISPLDRYETNAQLATRAHFWRVPPRLYRGDLPSGAFERLVEIDNTNIQWSCLRRTETGLLLRLWNPADQTEAVSVSSSRPISEMTKRTLDGKFREICGGYDFEIGPKQIVTLWMEFAEREGKRDA